MEVPVGQQSINFPGYGLFWVANSINSTLMGVLNRKTQQKVHESSLDFQKELMRTKETFEDEKIAEEVAFKRRLMSLGRQYKLTESVKAFDMQKRLSEMKYFLEHYWILDKTLPSTLFNEIQQHLDKGSMENKLNVILLHAPILPQKKLNCGANDKDDIIYKQMEYSIYNEDIPLLRDVHFRKDAHSVDGIVKYDLKGGNANLMNIHFLMSLFPTLVISPRFVNGKMEFNGAVWEAQAARPLIRNLFSFDHNPEEALKNDKYLRQQIDLFHSAVSIITGAVRDSYMMLTESKEPTLHLLLNDKNHEGMKNIVKNHAQLLNFVRTEQQSIVDALDANNTPKLLDVFHPMDIASMKKHLEENKF